MFLMKDQRAECGNGREIKVNKTTDSKLTYRLRGERKKKHENKRKKIN